MDLYNVSHVMAGEASVCGPLGLIAVAWVIMNRGGIHGFYGWGIPTQETVNLAQLVMNQSIEDPTNGAVFLFSKQDLKDERVKRIIKGRRRTLIVHCRGGLELHTYNDEPAPTIRMTWLPSLFTNSPQD